MHYRATKQATILPVVLATVFLLAGCASGPSPFMKVTPTDEDGVTSNQGRALVVLTVKMEDKDALIFKEKPMFLTFGRTPPLTVVEDGETVKKHGFRSYADRVVAVEPGHYYVTWLTNSIVSNNMVSHRGGWDSKTNTPKAFDFKVEAGDVVYLGHVLTRWPKGRRGEYLMMRVENREAEARKMIEDKFGVRGKEIAARMETKLVTVPKAIW